MNKKEFKEELTKLLSSEVENLNYEEKIEYAYDLYVRFQINNDKFRTKENKGKSWTDDELRIILSDAPTKENCLKYAKIFKRGYGSIAQIYQWAATPKSKVEEVRQHDSFITQIKKIAKEVGFIA